MIGGEQVFFISIILECSGFANQPVNNMAIMNAVSILAPQTRQVFNPSLGIPYLQMLSIDPHCNGFSNQTAVNRIGIV